MDFEWDGAKEQANRKKHGLDFRTAAKVFLDPHVIEFDDRDADDELRFNAIGLAHVPAKWDPVRRQGHAPKRESTALPGHIGSLRDPI